MRSESKKLTLILLGAFLFAVYCFVFGQSGIIERTRLEREKDALSSEIRDLERENRRLEAIYAKYSSDDMKSLECEKAGFIKSGERMLYFSEKKATSGGTAYKNSHGMINIEILRVVWISISVLIVVLYCGILYLKQRNNAFAEQQPGEDT